jgi:hypothetical protein
MDPRACRSRERVSRGDRKDHSPNSLDSHPFATLFRVILPSGR